MVHCILTLSLIHIPFNTFENRADPYQTSPVGAVWSGATLFAYKNFIYSFLLHFLARTILYNVPKWQSLKLFKVDRVSRKRAKSKISFVSNHLNIQVASSNLQNLGFQLGSFWVSTRVNVYVCYLPPRPNQATRLPSCVSLVIRPMGTTHNHPQTTTLSSPWYYTTLSTCYKTDNLTLIRKLVS